MALLPRVIGHRGAAARAPENSLAGFRKAAALGVECVEFDVRLSADGVPILFHDDRLGRTSDGRGAVGRIAFAELRKRDAGAWFGAAFKGEPIPSLAEALALLFELGLSFDLEMKAEPGRAQALAEAVAAALAQAWPAGAAPPIVSSFDAAALAAFAEAAPRVARGYLVGALPARWLAEARRLGAAAVICDHRRLDGARAGAIKAAGYPLAVYTVNEPARAKALYAFGVDAVISDAPDRLLASLPAPTPRRDPG